MKTRTHILRLSTVAMAALLAGCSQLDLQGTDPVDYYAQNPKKNTVETRNYTTQIHLQRADGKLSPTGIDDLRHELHPLSLDAIEMIHVHVAKSEINNEDRKAYLRRMMRNMGYGRGKFTFEPSTALARDDVQFDIVYAVVVPPDCPDWRTSPVTSHSNTWQGNFYCANEVNFGLMVADPHDLVSGRGAAEPDTQRASKALEDFRGGKSFSSSTSSSGSSSTSSSSSGSSGSEESK